MKKNYFYYWIRPIQDFPKIRGVKIGCKKENIDDFSFSRVFQINFSFVFILNWTNDFLGGKRSSVTRSCELNCEVSPTTENVF